MSQLSNARLYKTTYYIRLVDSSNGYDQNEVWSGTQTFVVDFDIWNNDTNENTESLHTALKNELLADYIGQGVTIEYSDIYSNNCGLPLYPTSIYTERETRGIYS